MAVLQREPTRQYLSPVMDYRRWANFAPRDGDIVVATYPKCGTTWTQRIVDLLIHQNTQARPIMEVAPWIDATFFNTIEDDLATLEAQTHRRAMKSHLPFDALPIYDSVKYVHVARDGRDACFSFHNHMLGTLPEAGMRIAMNSPVPLDGPPPPTPEDPREYYLDWIAQAEAGEGKARDLPFFEYEMTYWRERHRPNVLMVHYNDLKADLPGEMARISAFLDIDTPPDVLTELARAAEFANMKAQGPELLKKIEEHFDRGSDRFLNKGTNGRWKDILTADDVDRYQRLAGERLPPGARAWIGGGRLSAGDPRVSVD
jgi:aryl sulfotransferase